MTKFGKWIIIFILLPIIILARSFPTNDANPTAIINMKNYHINKYSLQIMIQNNQKRDSWGIGFFMLYPLIANLDKLNIQICEDDDERCTLLKVYNFNDELPISAGHVVLFVPEKHFLLEPSTAYKIAIKGLEKNIYGISQMPQQLFFYNFNNKQLSYIDVNEYKNKTFNIDKLQQKYAKQIREIWQQDNFPNSTAEIFPTPVSISYAKDDKNFNAKQSIKHIFYYKCKLNPKLQDCIDIANQPEGYVIEIKKKHTNVFFNTTAGNFYAKKTLEQLQPPFFITNNLKKIIDYPRFKYRGVMIDTVRHFFSVSEIKDVLDVMASSKLNTLHLHLADDEGWRIELKEFPELSRLGSIRGLFNKIPPANLVDERFDITNIIHKKQPRVTFAEADTNYAGIYTQKEIKDLVEYANNLQITIIPEIEMPAHARVMKLILPEIFSESKDISKYLTVQGYSDNILPICKYNINQQFTRNINKLITEVTSLFAFQTTLYYTKNEISLAGDEIPDNAFTGLFECKNLYWKNLSQDDIVHKYFQSIGTNLIDIKISGYPEIIENKNEAINKNFALNPIKIAHIWQWHTSKSSMKSTINLLNNNYPVVISFADMAYFDTRYAPKFNEPGLYWANNYANTYNALSLGNQANMINNLIQNKTKLKKLYGMEGMLWSELVPTKDHLFYMLLPKMLGLAQSAWANSTHLSWRSLARSLGCGQKGYLAFLHNKFGVNYRGYPNGINLEIPTNTLCVH